MLKIRLQGTTNDLKWFRKILERDNIIHLVEISEPFVNKGTNKYFRVYAEVKKQREKVGWRIKVMCRVIAIANQKGGVGKSTTTSNLEIGLVNEGKIVLLIDSDAPSKTGLLVLVLVVTIVGIGGYLYLKSNRKKDTEDLDIAEEYKELEMDSTLDVKNHLRFIDFIV